MITKEVIEKNKDLIKIVLILVIAIIVLTAGKKILDTILEALNLKDTKEELKIKAEADTQEKLSVNFFSPNFYKNYPNGYERDPKNISMVNAKIAAKNIYDSIGYIYDSPEKTKAAFNLAKTKADISKISDVFYSKYSKDLLIFLSDKLDTDKQKQNWILILKDLNSLPNGFKKI